MCQVEVEDSGLIPYRVNIFTCVRGPDIFPFILSIGITAQGIIFAVSQSQGLDGLFKAGCSLISQFMWPGRNSYEAFAVCLGES